MSDPRRLLEQVGEHAPFPNDAFERMLRRRDRKRRNQRLAAAGVGLAVFAAMVVFALTARPFDRGQLPASPGPTDGNLRRNGEVLVSHEGDLFAEDPATGAERAIMRLADLYACGENDCVVTERAEWSVDGDWVAVELISCLGAIYCGNPNAGLWVQGADEPRRQLTQTCTLDGCHAEDVWEWSPAGSRLALARNRRANGRGVGPSRLSVVDPADGDTVGLARSDEAITALAWAPNGLRLAYATGGSDPQVFLVDVVDGAKSTALAGDFGAVQALTWSPDGSRIAIDGSNRLFVVAADGSDLVLVTDDATASAIPIAPAWSPDGTRIAFRTAAPTTRARTEGMVAIDVWIASPDGTETVHLAATPCCTDEMWVAGPFWSPDGTRVAFTSETVSYQGGEFDAGIWQALAVDGSDDDNVIAPAVAKAWGGGGWPTLSP